MINVQIRLVESQLPGKVDILRPARREDIEKILSLFEDEVRAGHMLPRLPNEIRAHLRNWLVLERAGRLIGCVSLVFFNPKLCEIRSLAIESGLRGNGLGASLVRGALALAAQRGARRVITLTRSIAFFERLGFEYSQVANFPEKVWRDCRPCPLRHRCDETALIYLLDAHRT